MAEDINPRVKNLISELASYNDHSRESARLSLEALGKKAVPFLIEALKDKNDTVRWEATKALSEIGDIRAAPALVKALEDEEFGIRWTAAEGLIGMNVQGLNALFQQLKAKTDHVLLREGAHHVIHDLAKGELRKFLVPLLVALEGPAPRVQILVAIPRVMEDLKKAKML
jgi:HEAT repeat protein